MNEERLKQLIDRYYDGTSSVEEEEILRIYFSGSNIIPGYETERDIFCHYLESELYAEPSDDLEERILNTIEESVANHKKRISGRTLYSLISVAATFLLLIGSYFVFFQNKEPRDTFSDPRIAYKETMKILNSISLKINKNTNQLEPLTRLSNATLTSLESIDKSTSMIAAGLMQIQVFDILSEAEIQTNNTNNNK